MKNFFKSVVNGLVYAVVISIILALLLAIIMGKFDFSEYSLNIIYVVISSIALVIGAVVAAKAHGSRGWIVGLAVGIVYYIALYLINICFGGDAHFGMYEFYRLLMSIGAGTLAGMLGINL